MRVVVPFRAGGKSRLPAELRKEVALAMLGDVLEAVTAFGEALLVTDDVAAGAVAGRLGVAVLDDPGTGQGDAVALGLRQCLGPCLVVNADLPWARPSDLRALSVPPRLGALSLVEARDGTTNALGLPSPALFAPLFGSGSAQRFREHAAAAGVAVHELALGRLARDVDTLADLEAVQLPLGRRTRLVNDRLERRAAGVSG